MQRSSVDLPEPDGPMMQTTSPLRDVERDALQHLDGAERLVHVLERDDRLVGRPADVGGHGPLLQMRTAYLRSR